MKTFATAALAALLLLGRPVAHAGESILFPEDDGSLTLAPGQEIVDRIPELGAVLVREVGSALAPRPAAKAKSGKSEKVGSVHSPECLQSSMWITDNLNAWPGSPVSPADQTLAPVHVALVDGAVDPTHPALAGMLIDGVSVLQDGLSPFLLPNEPPDMVARPGNHHATAVASLLAAAGPNLHLSVYRVLGKECEGTSYDLAKAIVMAAEGGARVLVLPLGSKVGSKALRTAVAWAAARDVLIVAAAGNSEGPGLDQPAHSKHVLAVAGLDSDGGAGAYSSYGPWVGISDYGSDLDVAYPGALAGVASGTSLAAARTAAAAAVVRGEHPEWSAERVRCLLELTAAPLGDVKKSVAHKLGAGRTDVRAALLRAAADPTVCR